MPVEAPEAVAKVETVETPLVELPPQELLAVLEPETSHVEADLSQVTAEVEAEPKPERPESIAPMVEKPLVVEYEVTAVEAADVAPEMGFEIPEPFDETVLVIERSEAPVWPDYELSVAEISDSLEIDAETAQAAVLWSEQFANETVTEEIAFMEQPPTATLIELLPIEPEALPEILLNLPEANLQEAAGILEVILNTAAIMAAGEDEVQSSAEFVPRLELLVERLFVCLEIDYDKANVEAFVQAVMAGEVNLDFESLLEQQNQGTHERKYLATWLLAVLQQPIGGRQPDYSFLGRWVLRWNTQLSFVA